jgi:hypothetical protein
MLALGEAGVTVLGRYEGRLASMIMLDNRCLLKTSARS